jgi:hypothetical protein
MNGVDKAQRDLCPTCYLNEMELCDPEMEVCYNVILRSVAYLITEQRKGANDEGGKR